MRYDAGAGMSVPTWNDTAERRMKLLAELGLGEPDAEFDRFAAQISGTFAAELGGHGQNLYAMVNLFTEEEQTFVGLHNPPGMRAVDRTMRPDHGFCPEMLDRTKALILADVCANPHFASNPVVDKLGVRTYAGAPLIHEPTGTVLAPCASSVPIRSPRTPAKPRSRSSSVTVTHSWTCSRSEPTPAALGQWRRATDASPQR